MTRTHSSKHTADSNSRSVKSDSHIACDSEQDAANTQHKAHSTEFAARC